LDIFEQILFFEVFELISSRRRKNIEREREREKIKLAKIVVWVGKRGSRKEEELNNTKLNNIWDSQRWLKVFQKS